MVKIIFYWINAQVLMTGSIILASSVANHSKAVIYIYYCFWKQIIEIWVYSMKRVANIVCSDENYCLINPLKGRDANRLHFAIQV